MKVYSRDVAHRMNQVKVGEIYILTESCLQDMEAGLFHSALEILEENLIGFNVGCWEAWENLKTGNRHYKKVSPLKDDKQEL